MKVDQTSPDVMASDIGVKRITCVGPRVLIVKLSEVKQQEEIFVYYKGW